MQNGTKLIGIIGGSACSKDIYAIAKRVGNLIAERGAYLLCGGGGGVMEAACRGAKEAGGITIGILPGNNSFDANRWVDIPIVTGMGEARNFIIVKSAKAVIAINGSYGTLSEIAFSLRMDIPLIGLKTWEVSEKIISVETAEAAVREAYNRI